MNFKLNRRNVSAVALFSAMNLVASKSFSQTWPERPIKIVVPFAPGAGTDAMGRLIAQKLSELLANPVVVENRAGASGAIGSQYVAQSPADGYTLLLIAAPFTTVPASLPNGPRDAGYDPVRSFAPICHLAKE